MQAMNTRSLGNQIDMMMIRLDLAVICEYLMLKFPRGKSFLIWYGFGEVLGYVVKY